MGPLRGIAIGYLSSRERQPHSGTATRGYRVAVSLHETLMFQWLGYAARVPHMLNYQRG